MSAIIGALIGILIVVVTPWSDIVIQPINSVLADPSISSNPGLSSMISALGIIAAYLFPPLFGAAGGFFVDNSG